MQFPWPAEHSATGLVYVESESGLPVLQWTGSLSPGRREPLPAAAPLVRFGPGTPLLGEQAHERLTRPHLRGHRPQPATDAVSTGWTPQFICTGIEQQPTRLVIDGTDTGAGLEVSVTFESLPGGSLRGRCRVTNTGATPYVVDGLEVVVPVPDHFTECLDLTGRHERERSPQRHAITDGLWLRESRGGRPGLDSATTVIAGSPGFGTTHGEVLGAHVAWSGNSVLRLERTAATGTTLGGGELLQPGEVVLQPGDSYSSPWVMFTAGTNGLDDLAASLHTYQRSLPAHPGTQPVILNVWEAVYFDHDLDRLIGIVDRAAQVGVELFVLDDGWFRGRRDDRAGLGDWWIDPEVWPAGLGPLIDRVHAAGMRFGLWFEPEMVNPDSDLYRDHPEWILSSGDRVPHLHRHQLVLDLTRPEVAEFLFDRVSSILGAHAIDYVKWDHNRDLLEAGSGLAAGAPVPHAQTEAYYALLDRLRAAHPSVAWESCASGGGRIDLGVLERVQRVWTSDMTDALARQQIQRWTGQLVAPEYVGAHVSSPTSHTTGRTLPLAFRAATALFGSFGIEWDLTTADAAELAELAEWIELYRAWRSLLHSGRVIRPESPDPAVLLHGVVAHDTGRALVAHVQLDESTNNRGVWVRIPRLDPGADYDLTWLGPVATRETSMSVTPFAEGPTDGVAMTGADLGARGFWMPRMRPETITLIRLDQR